MSKPFDRAWMVEVCAAVVISLAAAMTSWVGFQAALWDGEQAAHYAQAGAARVEATSATTEAGQLETADLLMFQGWLSAAAQDEPELQHFYRQRFRPEFAAAFEAWLKTDPLTNPAAPAGPSSCPSTTRRGLAEARRRQRQADDLFNQGQRDNDISDRFVRGTVLLAVALFFGGIAQDLQVDDDQGGPGRHGVRGLRDQRPDGRQLAHPSVETFLVTTTGFGGAPCPFQRAEPSWPCVPPSARSWRLPSPATSAGRRYRSVAVMERRSGQGRDHQLCRAGHGPGARLRPARPNATGRGVRQ